MPSNCAVFFLYIFQSSLEQQKVPSMWKESTGVPVAKVKSPKALNDYCSVALTFLVMKTFEHIVGYEILQTVDDMLDPLQFVYRARRGVEDPTATLKSCTEAPAFAFY